MVNYVLSFCKITGASKIFKRNFYLPLLKPLTPKEALRTLRITGKWLLGAKIQHYIPVLLNHQKKRSTRSKNYGKLTHEEMPDFTYMTPVLDSENENHKLLSTILDSKKGNGMFVYTVEDKKYNIVMQAQLERAILDGDVIDVLVSQKNDKIIVKLKSMKKIPLEIQYYDGNSELYCGEGATTPKEEQFHHHGKYTMSLAKIFEDKELTEERWEEELKKIMKRRRKRAKQNSKEIKQLMKESLKNLDWKKFEEEAKKVIAEIEQPAEERDIEMEIENLEATKHVNETILKRGPDLLGQLPTMKEIPDIIKSMGNATFTEIEDEIDDEALSEKAKTKRRVSGVKVTLPSGKECFVSGQMVHTDNGDVFVPGQTIESEYGLEYAPGITINVDNKPTLINGLIMGEEEREPMFLPTESTITADGQLTFATAPEERPKPLSEEVKQERKKRRKLQSVQFISDIEEQPEIPTPVVEIEKKEFCEQEDKIDEISEDGGSTVDEKSTNDVSSVELNNSDIEELDMEAIRQKQEQEKLELEKLKLFLIDDGLDDIIASIEEKRAKLQKKLDELRKLNVMTENSLVTYISDSDTIEIASKISDDENIINRLSDIFMTMTRRAATFFDKNSINADNVNQSFLSLANSTETDLKFHHSTNKLKMLMKMAIVAANEIFKTRPKDQLMALNSVADITVDVLKNDNKIRQELLKIMETPMERNEICNSIFKELTQCVSDANISILNNIAFKKLAPSDVIDQVEKILKKKSEIQCEAFTKIARRNPSLIQKLVEQINKKIGKAETEEDALELLQNSLEEATKSTVKSNLQLLIDDKSEHPSLKNEALSVAKTLGLNKIQEILEESNNLGDINDKSTQELFERVVLFRCLAEKDYSLKCAFERLKKNPERARSDPRIRQLVRESATLMAKRSSVRSSRDVPLQLLKTGNLLAIEDFLIQRMGIDCPVLICKNELQAVIPKEAARGVLAGRVPYVLIDESGVTNFKPMHMFTAIGTNNKNREKRITDYLNGGLRKQSIDSARTYLQNNVRNVEKLFNNSSREVA